MKIIPIDNWDKHFWGMNVPVQFWKRDDDPDYDEPTYNVVNYMPRKAACCDLEPITQSELPAFCQNSAAVLRNLADLIEALGRGEIDHVYYADQDLEEAKRKKKEERRR